MADLWHPPADEMLDAFVGCWTDPAFAERFKKDPKETLSSWGVKVPDNVELVILEDTPERRHIVIPVPPTGTEFKETSRLSAIADACVASACRPCASFKDRGT